MTGTGAARASGAGRPRERPARGGTASRVMKAALLACTLLVLGAGCGRPPAGGFPPAQSPPPVEPAASPVLNPLTGLPVPDAAALRQRPVVVAIDNHPDARPQAGLTEADLVYEVPAEGGITRLLAVFVTARPERVGPVRSSRHYFLDLAREWDAVYVHAGGSPQHYARIARSGLGDLDGVRDNPQGGGRPVFTRDRSRAMPHNLYASLPVALAAARERGWTVEAPGAPEGRFRFVQAEGELDGDPARRVTIHWPGWRRGWVRYVLQDDGRYRRETAYGVHRAEETGRPIAPVNLLIQFAPSAPIAGDKAGRLDVEVTGSGRLLIVSGGRVREGRWEKAGPDAPTLWLDEDGGPARVRPGPTWVHVVPSSTRVDIEPAPEPAGSAG